MGVLLVYDITDLGSFNNIRNWMKNIEQHASDNINKILVGNKCDMDDGRRAVPYATGKALADEFGIPFLETSAKGNVNVEQVFCSIAKDVMQRLAAEEGRARQPQSPGSEQGQSVTLTSTGGASGGGVGAKKSGCC